MVVESVKNCTSCGLCVACCPTKCLKFELNSEGFYRPKLIKNQGCINCGLCESVCPASLQAKKEKPLLALAIKIKDREILSTVSSGGVCYKLAQTALNSGVNVCACVYDVESHQAKHVVVNDSISLEATKGSKYFQSYTVDAFSKIFDGNKWIVFGTPCQIAAIDLLAKKKKIREKMILVDFFCHGTPSMNLWKKYIKEKDVCKINKIDFRSKEFGWHSFSLKFTYENGKTCSDYKENMFYNFFFNNLCLNDSCYDCRYKALSSSADIRVGDYWGETYKSDTEGVSCCLAFTDNGKLFLENILEDCEYQNADVADLLKAQMVKSPEKKKERIKVLKALKGKRKLITIYNTTLFGYRVKCKIKALLGRK